MCADILSFDELKNGTKSFIESFDKKFLNQHHAADYFKLQEALKSRRPVSVPDVFDIKKKKSDDLNVLIKTLTNISRTQLRRNLTTEQHPARQMCVEALLDRMKWLKSTSLNMPEMRFTAQQTSNAGKLYSFGKVKMAFNLCVREGLSMDEKKERDNFCKSCDIFLMTSRYYSEKGPPSFKKQFEKNEYGLLSFKAQYETFLSNETEVLKLEPTKLKPKTAKKVKANDGTVGVPESSFHPQLCSLCDDGQNILMEWLEWLDLQVQCNSAFESFKDDGRKRTDDLVAKRYYNLVFKFTLPWKEFIYTNQMEPNVEKAVFDNHPVYAVSPEFVFETHSRQDIDPDGFYLWKLAFGSFDRAQTVSDIVDKMLMPRFKGVLVNALEAIKSSGSHETPKACTPDEADDLITMSTRDAIFHAIKSLLQELRKIPKGDRKRRTPNIRTSFDPNSMTADELVGGPLSVGEKSKKRIWSWFQDICDSIDLQRSGRESTKDTIVKRENFGRMIKDGVHMGIMTKDQSERVLSEQPAGVFLLRFSTSCHEECWVVLSLVAEADIEHFSFPVVQSQSGENQENVALRILNKMESFSSTSGLLSRKSDEFAISPISVLKNYSAETKPTGSKMQPTYQDGNQLSLTLARMNLSRGPTPSTSSVNGSVGSQMLSPTGGVQLIGHEDVFMSSLIDQQDNFNGNQMGVGGNEYSNLQSLSGLMALSHQSGPVTQVLGVLMDNQSNVPPDLQDCDPDPTLIVSNHQGSVTSNGSELPTFESFLESPTNNPTISLQIPNEEDDSPEMQANVCPTNDY
ncbi:uncharacterized protein LOC134853997 isoform X3 [Symsagittifera roscoffensis]|uniref:uncharacterized protein LOC134853997 isoform X3 n=1 Tax=Symsagittifera roscoffensis TaxID=84072 RepID=UPI00307C8469